MGAVRGSAGEPDAPPVRHRPRLRRAPGRGRRPPVHDRRSGDAGPARRTGPPAPPRGTRERFATLDAYRVAREWKRYEGTPQRDLFRELRQRFLVRHASPGRWVLDLGAGPGRFSPLLGGPDSRRVLLDLSEEMLKEARRRLGRAVGAPDLVRGDAARPPFKRGRFSEVVLLGNVVGFAGAEAGQVLENALRLLADDGTVIVETAPSGGERSRYLTRLPPGALRRLLVAPINAIRPRLEREGFRSEPAEAASPGFRRMDEAAVAAAFAAQGVRVAETLAVAPALGGDAVRVAAVRPEPAAWRHLLELEELLGRTPVRKARAASLLVAGRRPPARDERPSQAMG